jgi:hypothetical protein
LKKNIFVFKIAAFFNKEIKIQIEILFQRIFKIQMEIHPKKVFENALQVQILSKYTSLVVTSGAAVEYCLYLQLRPRHCGRQAQWKPLKVLEQVAPL